jgi:Ca-activated chloride channel homolog
MAFLSPHNLWLLAAVPALGVLYWALCWRRKRTLAAEYPGLGLAHDGSLRRHLPAMLLAAAFAIMLGATARPAAVLTLAAPVRTVMLAIDISGSMQADDVAPTRLEAAQAAAIAFVEALPGDVRVGVVAFTDTASLLHPLTDDHAAVANAIRVLQPQQGTAIGSGILVALQELLPPGSPRINLEESASAGSSVQVSASRGNAQVDASSAIVLLTDGQNTDGPAPSVAALLAAQHGVRVYTVGIGTPKGQIHRGLVSAMPVGVDESSLRHMAALTKGEYFYATSAPDLREIYAGLSAKLTPTRRKIEVTALFCALGAAMLAAAGLLSVLGIGPRPA